MVKKKRKKAKTGKTKKKNNNKRKKKTKKPIMPVIITIIIIIAAVAVLRNFYPQKQKTAAMVNGETITMQDLNKRFELFKFLIDFGDLPEEVLLEQMINERLLLQEAAKQDIVIDKKEPEKQVANFIERSFMTKTNFEKLLKANTLSLSDMEQYYREQLIIIKFIDQKLLADIELTDEEIKNYYNNNIESFAAKQGEIRARHILVKTKQEAEVILKNLKKGQGFAGLAKENSICPSASKGGELGFFSRGQMVPEFEETAFALKVNEISEPVKTEFGWHIIQREPSKIYLAEATNIIKEKLLLEKEKEHITIYLDGLREKSDIFNYLEEEEITGAAVEEQKESLEAEETEKCFEKYDVTSETVIFYHASWCPYCQNMMPIVEELEEEGYSFHWTETSSGEGTALVEECFSDILQGAVPQFICTGTKDFKLGEITKKELEEFAENCR